MSASHISVKWLLPLSDIAKMLHADGCRSHRLPSRADLHLIGIALGLLMKLITQQ